jgi:hypothetical protein
LPEDRVVWPPDDFVFRTPKNNPQEKAKKNQVSNGDAESSINPPVRHKENLHIQGFLDVTGGESHDRE